MSKQSTINAIGNVLAYYTAPVGVGSVLKGIDTGDAFGTAVGALQTTGSIWETFGKSLPSINMLGKSLPGGALGLSGLGLSVSVVNMGVSLSKNGTVSTTDIYSAAANLASGMSALAMAGAVVAAGGITVAGVALSTPVLLTVAAVAAVGGAALTVASMAPGTNIDVSGLMADMKASVQELTNTFGEAFTDAVNAVSSAMSSAADAVTGFAEYAMGQMQDYLTSLTDQIRELDDALKAFIDDALGADSNFSEELVNEWSMLNKNLSNWSDIEYMIYADQLYTNDGSINPDTLGNPAWLSEFMPSTYHLAEINSAEFIDGMLGAWIEKITYDYFIDTLGSEIIADAVVSMIKNDGLDSTLDFMYNPFGSMRGAEYLVEHAFASDDPAVAIEIYSIGHAKVTKALKNWKSSELPERIHDLILSVAENTNNYAPGESLSDGVVGVGTVILSERATELLAQWIQMNTGQGSLWGIGSPAVDIDINFVRYLNMVETYQEYAVLSNYVAFSIKDNVFVDLRVADGDNFTLYEPGTSDIDNIKATIDIGPFELNSSAEEKPVEIESKQEKESFWERFKKAIFDPLILDLDGNGIHTLSIEDNSAKFNLLGLQGVIAEHGWISPDDGFLALDLNGNGSIDDISELFGQRGLSGFAELSQYDSNGDGVIDVQDQVFSDLLVWRDANGDGVSQREELFSLEQLGIQSISLATSSAMHEDQGNLISAVGTFSYVDGRVHEVADVNFAVDISTLRSNGQADLFDFTEAQGRQSLAGFEAGLDQIRLDAADYQALVFSESHRGTLIKVSDELEIDLVGIKTAELSEDYFVFAA